MDADGFYLDELLSSGLLLSTGADGLYGRSGTFEQVAEAVAALVTRAGAGSGAEVMRFPPAMSRKQFEQSEYLKGFPHLAGTVHCFCGDERGHRELLRHVELGDDWTGQQQVSDVVLTPAACYPVYPIVARRGPVPRTGVLVDVASYCFRHEPSREPTRMQMFRMHEHVCIGTPEQVLAFRSTWLERGKAMAASLGLPSTVDIANDPFLGRTGQVLADSQRSQQLKFELLIPVNSPDRPTACVSFNYHVGRFGTIWGLRGEDGEVAHSACVGFGLERLALALFRHHGFDPRGGRQG